METTLLFKTMIILIFELSIAFGLCIYCLRAAKRAALAGKPFFGIDFTLAVNMNNEVDLIPDSSRNIQYPRKMTKFVEVPICLLYTSPSPRDMRRSRMPSSA